LIPLLPVKDPTVNNNILEINKRQTLGSELERKGTN
jgi:hypothetical protein